jgi:hypothetical protein
METMLVLNINPELEEELVDYLLSLECIEGFTSYLVRGHGVHKSLSISEQVSGRRKRLQVEVIMQETEVKTVLAGLVDNVGRDIVFWQQMIANVGKVELLS